MPASRGKTIEISEDDAKDDAAVDQPAPDVLAEARGPAADAQPERSRDALEPDQQVVPGDEDAEDDRHDRDVQGVDLRQLLGRRRDRLEGVERVAERGRQAKRLEDLGDVPRDGEADLVPVERLAGQRDDEGQAGQADADQPEALPCRVDSRR